MYVFYNISFQYLKAFEVALFTIFTPIYVALINNAIERKWYWFYILTSVTAIIGTAFIVQTSFDRPGILTGFIIIQLSNICFAVGQVLYRKLMRLHSEVRDMDIFGLTYLGGFLTALIISPFIVDYGNITITPLQWGNLIYLGVLASGLGFFLWNYGARRTNIGALAIFNNLKIPLSITVSLIFFNETADLIHLFLGGAIILVSLGINEMMEHQRLKNISMSC
jgi:drug/metabolite transporter (DMT)-like permease